MKNADPGSSRRGSAFKAGFRLPGRPRRSRRRCLRGTRLPRAASGQPKHRHLEPMRRLHAG